MLFKISLISILLCTSLPLAARADTALGFTYTRSNVNIIRNQMPAPLPWIKGPPPNPTISFDVEIRDAATVYNRKLPGGQSGWYNLSSPADNKGVMIVFHAPGQYPIVRSTEYAPLDILLIDSEGKILQIVSQLKLSELDHDIVADKPVLAFLFLQGGITRKLSINPGDMIDYNIFKKSAVILNVDQTRVLKAAPEPTPSTNRIPELFVPDAADILKK